MSNYEGTDAMGVLKMERGQAMCDFPPKVITVGGQEMDFDRAVHQGYRYNLTDYETPTTFCFHFTEAELRAHAATIEDEA